MTYQWCLWRQSRWNAISPRVWTCLVQVLLQGVVSQTWTLCCPRWVKTFYNRKERWNQSSTPTVCKATTWLRLLHTIRSFSSVSFCLLSALVCSSISTCLCASVCLSVSSSCLSLSLSVHPFPSVSVSVWPSLNCLLYDITPSPLHTFSHSNCFTPSQNTWLHRSNRRRSADQARFLPLIMVQSSIQYDIIIKMQT